jgi:tripartite-type tricarboxylate transporter receptor subunit TctC
MKRRPLLASLLASAALPARGQAQSADDWPPATVRIIVPFAPGAFTDTCARLLGQELTELLRQQVVVENRGGAGGTLGASAAVRAAPDGLTLLLTDNSLAMSVSLYAGLPYDPLKDLAQISRVADSPSILLVRPGLGVRSVAELVELAKRRPGELTFGSGGQGSSAHLATEQLMQVAGIRMLHVPFRGVAVAISEVLAGRVDMSIASLASGVTHVNAGTLLGLGVTGAHRAAALPQVPTFIEASLPAYDMTYWWGLAAPVRTPAPIIAKLNREVGVALKQKRLQDAFAAQGAAAVHSTPEEMTAHLAREIATWREVVNRAGVRLE